MAMSCLSMWMRKITWKSSEITGKKQLSDMVCKVSNNDTLGDNVWLGGNTVVCQSDLHALSEGKSCWGIHKRIFHHSLLVKYWIYSFPHISNSCSTFLNFSPISLNLYSTFGGICWYSMRSINPSSSSFFNCLESVVCVISSGIFFAVH